MIYIIVIALSYLLGSFSTAYFVGKLKGVDIRKVGSGNLGASNTKVALGWGYGILVAVVDVSKAAIAVLISRMLFCENMTLEILACASAVIGHMFPFYLNFKGGKGYAAYTGGILMIDYRIGLCFALLGLIITLITNYIALATCISSALYPIVFKVIYNIEPLALLFMLTLAIIIIYKHKDNIVRIKNGTEIGALKRK